VQSLPAMRRRRHLITEPCIEDVEHVYFYAATPATPELVKQYLQQAYELGRSFERPATGCRAIHPGRLT
jgi:hypothetical protein